MIALKKFSIQPHPTYLSTLKICTGGIACVPNCFMLSSLPCFPAFCWIAIPTSCYILFFNLVYVLYESNDKVRNRYYISSASYLYICVCHNLFYCNIQQSAAHGGATGAMRRSRIPISTNRKMHSESPSTSLMISSTPIHRRHVVGFDLFLM